MESIFARDVAPPQDDAGMTEELLRPGNSGYLRASDTGFFATEEELKDTAAGVALQGGPINPALEGIRQGYAARLVALGHQCLTVVGEINEGLREVREKIYLEGERKTAVENSIYEQKDKKEKLEADLRRLDVEIETSLQEIRKARLDHGKKFFEK